MTLLFKHKSHIPGNKEENNNKDEKKLETCNTKTPRSPIHQREQTPPPPPDFNRFPSVTAKPVIANTEKYVVWSDNHTAMHCKSPLRYKPEVCRVCLPTVLYRVG